LSMCGSTPRRTDVSGNISWTPVVRILCEATPFPGIRVLPRTGGIPMETRGLARIKPRPRYGLHFRLAQAIRRIAHDSRSMSCETGLQPLGGCEL
jgi:hypothetical protein